MDFTTLIILALVVGVAIAILQAVVASNNKKELTKCLSSTPDFTMSKQILGVDGLTGLAIDEPRSKLCLLALVGGSRAKVIDPNALISAELFEDGASITKTSRTSQAGGALVGGLMLGGVGAIIGGLSGTTKTTSKVKRIELRLTVDDSSNPLHDVVLMNVEGEKGGIIYNAAMQEARTWIGLIDVLMRRADNRSESKIVPIPAPSVADELSKLAALRASGLLTEEEFQTQKQRTLNSNGTP